MKAKIANDMGSVKKLLDSGLSLREIQQLFVETGFDGLPKIGDDNSPLCQLSLNHDPYNQHYFDEINEGKNFYSLKNMSCYTGANGDKRLPQNGIITRDGTIFRADNLHMETALWLKFNGVNLKNSLRFTYFVDSKRIEIRDGYDFVPVDNNNMDELYVIWSELHDENLDDWDLEPTEEQIQAIYYLKTYLSNRYRANIDFEKIFENNVGFRMNPHPPKAYTKEQLRVGDNNNDTINHALKKLFAKKGNLTLGV